MAYELGTNTEEASRENLKAFLDHVFKQEPWKSKIGPKGIDVIYEGQNAPSGLYVNLVSLGRKEPNIMSDDSIHFFTNEEWSYILDVRTPDTDFKIADTKVKSVKIKNTETNSVVNSSTNESTDSCIRAACNAIYLIFTALFYTDDTYRKKLNELGLYSPRLQDERESFGGAEYQNPYRLTFEVFSMLS